MAKTRVRCHHALFKMQPDLFAPAEEPDPKPKIFTVSEITRSVRSLIEDEIGRVWIEGEIGNLRTQSSGHQYFTLKDERCQLACVLFAGQRTRMRQVPIADGLRVQALGALTVYEARGQYQLIVEIVQPVGAGALQAKFEALKRKLDAEGLFDPARKKPLPKFPKTVGLVTSPTGAAIRDMIHVLRRRAPWIGIVIHPVRVQGDGAAEEIAAAVGEFNRARELGIPRPDVIVVARGGGSAEDLWEFNEEIVARAIFASEIPVVSAVGHEIDFTISDFVADLRAPTPSAAAELIAPDSAELRRHFSQLGSRLQRCALVTMERWKARLGFILRGVLLREPPRRVAEARQRVDLLDAALNRAAATAIAARRQRLADFYSVLLRHRPDQIAQMQRQRLGALVRRMSDAAIRNVGTRRVRVERASGLLRVLSPESTLDRGYSITMNAAGEIVNSVKNAAPGTRLRTKLRDGELHSTVDGKQRAD